MLAVAEVFDLGVSGSFGYNSTLESNYAIVMIQNRVPTRVFYSLVRGIQNSASMYSNYQDEVGGGVSIMSMHNHIQ